MQKTETWGEWLRKVSEAAFMWLLVSLGAGFASGAILGELSLYFFLVYAVPACLMAFAVNVTLLWRRRPNS
jgi:hypothetical protein